MKRKLGFYDVLLLIVGLAVTSIGFLLIRLTYQLKGPSWEALITLFLWLILIAFFIGLAALQEFKESVLKQLKR